MTAIKKLTQLQWATIATIHQTEAEYNCFYRFVGSERRVAERMVASKLLRPKGKKFPGQYKVTAKGEKVFRRETSRKVKKLEQELFGSN